MKLNKIMIASILLLAIFTIGAASAADIIDSTDDVLAIDSADDIQTTQDISADLSISVEDENPLSSEKTVTGSGMSDIDAAVKSASAGDTITLENDVEQDTSTYVMLNKAITLDGQGHSIDMKGISYAFRVHNAHVILKNLTIKNGADASYAGAIYATSTGSYNIEDCTFINNVGKNGALYTNLNSEIDRSTFTNNTVTNSGGAIYVPATGSCKIENCTFINNNADLNGGALYIYSDQSTEIYGCTFINNTATSGGGAIYVKESVDIDNCIFSNNNAENGAAVYVYDTNSDSSSITNCDFTGNTGKHGAAAYIQDSEIINCNFANNVVDDTGTEGSRGGALYINGASTITDCTFTNNRAKTKGYGGAIYLKKNSNITNCNFTSNAARVSGGAVYAYTGASCNLVNCNFTNNQADTADNAYGGAFFADAHSTLSNCIFTENSAISTGGAIYIAQGGCDLTDCVFTGNNAGTSAGAVFSQRDHTCDLKNCEFESNTAGTGGAFYGHGNLDNCSFIDNHAIAVNDAGDPIGDGGAVFSFNDINITNSIFIANTANRDGGAILSKQKGNVDYSTFINNTADRYGGSINLCNANGCDIIGSTARNGAGIYKGDATDCYIVNCTTTNTGSAIYSGNAYDSKIFNCYNPRTIVYNGTVENCIIAESPQLYCPDIDVTPGETATVPVRVLDKDGNDVNGLNVDVEVYQNGVMVDSFTTTSGTTLTFDVYEPYVIELNSKCIDPITVNINVGKESPELEIEANPITVGETATIIATLAEEATGNVIISVNGRNYTVQIVSGEAGIEIVDLAAGDYEVIAIYGGDETFDAQTATATLTVAKPSPFISAPAVTTKYGKDVNITVYLESDVSGNVWITINKAKQKTAIKNGVATYTVSGLNYGLYPVDISYNGNYKYCADTISTTLKVNKNSPITSVVAESITYGEDATVTVNVAKNVPGNIKITVNGVTVKAPITNGAATATFTGLKAKTYDVTAVYGGNVNYVSQTKTASLTVTKGTPIISVDAPDASFGTPATITVNLKGDVPGNVRFTINGVTEKAPITNGVATYTVSGLKAGSHAVSISYAGNANYNAQTVDATLKIVKASPITSVSVENINVGDTAVVVVKMANNVNGNVKITVNGVAEKVKIVNGIATLNVTGLKAGTYDVSAYYAGNANFNAQTSTSSFTVGKSSPGLSMTVATKSGKTTVTANIAADAPGNVKVIVDGGTPQSAKITNGVATYTISGLSSGTHTIKVTYAGNYKYTAQSRTKTITI